MSDPAVRRPSVTRAAVLTVALGEVCAQRTLRLMRRDSAMRLAATVNPAARVSPAVLEQALDACLRALAPQSPTVRSCASKLGAVRGIGEQQPARLARLLNQWVEDDG